MINKLKGLDTLRAIAAIVVLWGHIELLKERNNIDAPAYWGPNGQFGVVLFFVLSGFLITYLIVKEKQKYGDFSFKKFSAISSAFLPKSLCSAIDTIFLPNIRVFLKISQIIINYKKIPQALIAKGILFHHLYLC